MIVKDRRSRKFIYFRVIDLAKSNVYYEFIDLIVIEFYLKAFEVFKVIYFILTRKNLHLLEGYIYYYLQLCLL